MGTRDKKVILAPYVRLGYSGKALKLGFGSIQTVFTDKPLQEAVIEVCHYLLKPRTLGELNEFISKLNVLEDPQKSHLRTILKNRNIYINFDFYNREDRYSRHSLFYNMSGANPKEVQNKLQDSHVALVGCGGIGTVVGVNLATAGIGRLTLIDDDHIELSNLTRQILFTEDDINKSKAKVLKDRIEERARNIQINLIEKLLDSEEKFIENVPACDLLVVSGDSPNISTHANIYSFKKNIPFINIGYIQDIAIWGPFIIPGKTPCFRCFSNQNISRDQASDGLNSKVLDINKKYQAPSIGPVNMLSGAAASLDILKYLGKFGEIQSLNRRVGIWTNELRIEYQDYARSEECPICS